MSNSLFRIPSELQVSHTIKALIYGEPGKGKAQPVDALVLTPYGFKRIGDLVVGDEVIGSDGKSQTVEGVFPQGKRPVFRVSFNDGASVLCDLEHIWTVVEVKARNKGYKNMTLKEIIEKGFFYPSSDARTESGRKPVVRFAIPLMKAAEYESKDFEIDPYILGVLIGDGTLTQNIAAFSTPDKDAFIAKKVESLLPDGYYLRKRSEPACPQYTIKRTNEEGEGFLSKVKRLGLNVHSGDKFIPPTYFFGSHEQRLELLRGLMDTDGFSMERNRVLFTTTSKRLADDVIELIRSLGGIGKLHIKNRKDKTTEYHVNVKLNECPFNLERKAENWRKSNITRHMVGAVEEGESECVCIKVSNEDELYITEHYIVTHNTTLALSAPTPLLLDFDGGVQRVNGAFQCPTLQVESWEQVNEALNEIESGSVPCKTIVIDTAGKMLDYMGAAIIKDNSRYRKADGSLTLQGYGVRKSMFVNFLKRVSIMGKHVVFVAHMREDKDGDTRLIRPEIGGSSAGDLIKELDLVGFMSAIGKDRTVFWSGDERFYAKNTCNLPAAHKVLNIVDENGNVTGENNFLTLVFAQYEANLKNTANVRAKYDKLLENFCKGIDAVKDAATATEVFGKIESYANHVWDSKVRTEKMLAAKAESLGLKFDAINSKYEAA